MAEYIDREALIADLGKSVVISCKNTNVPLVQRVLRKIINCIKDQPAAEVKHGEWVLNKSKTTVSAEAKCSVCGRDCVYQVINGVYELENYCPHCGAKMDKEDLQWKK